MKKLLSILLTFAMLLPTTVLAEDDEIKVFLDGEQIQFDVQPIIENERTLVPMRAIAEKLGLEVKWAYPEDITTRVTVVQDDINVIFTIGSNALIVNDNITFIDTPPIIVNDRTLVPLRAVSEAFDCDVQWDGDTRTVTIKTQIPHTDEPVEILEPVEAEGTYVQKLMANIPKDKNTVISPFSMKVAMMMLANGTQGETQKEILKTFGVDDIDKFNEYILSKINSYVPDERDYYYFEDEELNLDEVKISNSIWFNKDYYKNSNSNFSKEFTDAIAKYYGGTAKTITNDTYASEVNEWISEMTYGRIPSIMPERDNENTLLSIINTIYMKAKWWLEFQEEDTKKDIFTDIDGNKVTTDFMNKETTYSYYEDDNMRMVGLQYQNGLYMWLVLGDDTDFINKIDQAASKTVKLSMPKFKIEYSADYSKILQSIGINKAFANNNNDFKPMIENVPEYVKINSVLQKTTIDVNEKGTEASAVTDIGLVGLGRPDEQVEFKADRPFTYYIVDGTKDNEVLFAGRYVKPE